MRGTVPSTCDVWPNSGEVESELHCRDFPGGAVVRTPRFHCRGHGFDPWSGN